MTTYPIGTIFKIRRVWLDETEAILAQIAPAIVALINLRTGNRITEGIKTLDYLKVTEEELKKINFQDAVEVEVIRYESTIS